MYEQLHSKLIKQDEQLLNETNINSPLFIQRKQLQKDLNDFQILEQCQNLPAMQQIIERVEHMAMFNKNYHVDEVGSITQVNKQSQSVIIQPMKSISVLCSYRVWLNFFRKKINRYSLLEFMS